MLNRSGFNLTSIHCPVDTTLFVRYVGTTVVILGYIGNFLSIYIFSRKALRTRSCSWLFLALAISNCFVLTGYTTESLLLHGYYIKVLSHWSLCKMVIFLIYASTDISNYLLTAAAIDRCIAVNCISARHTFCKPKIAKCEILFLIIIMSFINAHFLFGFHMDKKKNCSPKKHQYEIFFIHHYDSYVDIIKSILIPFTIMIICNLIIIFRLFRKLPITIKHKKSQRRQEKDRQLTLCLVITSFIFFILTLPSEVNDFLRSKINQKSQEKYVCQLWFLTTVLIIIYQINYASHFYIYTLTGSIFRKELKKICFLKERHYLYSEYHKRNSIIEQYPY
ncbi:unnamed protein product [Didymodactylos carnosus]|uniref:G-protein coupled receptors family 1 profile domain-containing protein n=1 Tax=Didymodactylos carnosus TaxID=1234261 RepID=A0A814UP91_9BILA|nr:unnamed protein product [Didymodactylos carnosus]CAF1450866.1 unnamed protein product [Didymodactylos carnosus]CAF3940122.1 unnamed protein product [Didymodactylos carnosus]CAF4245629.1 unnamed protein product [Didymodactylos carnosus]